MRNITREKFDQHGEFVCVHNFLHGGKQLRAGDPFNKSSVDARRLRQLYDTRYIKLTEKSEDMLNDAFDAPKSEKKLERVRLSK